MKRFKKLFLSLVFILLSFISVMLISVPVSAKEASSLETKETRAQEDNSWKLILDNVDMEIQYLDPNKYLGLFFDSYANGKKDDAYLYLCWTSKYMSNPRNTIIQFTEGGRVYSLYNDKVQMINGLRNWLPSRVKTYPHEDLNLYMTPIGGIKDGNPFGIQLKRSYSFTNVKFGLDGTDKIIGQIAESIKFDLGSVPENNGKNAMQLCTHGYEIIKDCEAQSYMDLIRYGGYGHFVHFNTTIRIDKIYRVDVSYVISNDNKKWWENIFFDLPNEEHQITKSLKPEKIRQGIFGLFEYAGFKQGTFKSAKDESKSYKYELFLNYDENVWDIFNRSPMHETQYKRVKDFQILRMNYLVDNTTYDVPIKMDVIDGESLSIFDSDLILDVESTHFDINNTLDDLFTKINQEWSKYKRVIVIALAAFLGIFIFALIIRFFKIVKAIMGPIGGDDDNNRDSGNSSG